MQKNPAIAELKSRAVLRVSGTDSVPFLQNLISQDLGGAIAGKPIFSALLTPQGKYLYDFFVLKDGDSFLLDAEADRAKDFLALLARFRIRGDVTFADVRGDYSVYAIWDGDADHPGAFTDPRLAALGQRLVVKKPDALAANSDEHAYAEHRYALGVAEGGYEIVAGNATLLEINFDALNGVSFDKGCYMGQELTARTHYRGLIKRRYLPFRFEGSKPHKMAHILFGGFELGEIHAIGSEHGIGLFHLEHTKPHLNSKIAHGGTVYEIFVPDYLEKFIH